MLESNIREFSKLINNTISIINKTDHIKPVKKVINQTIDNEIKKPIVPEIKKTTATEIKNTAPTKNAIEVLVQKLFKRPKIIDTKIPILKSLIYLGGIANEEELKKYMKQYSSRNGDKDISINELRINLDSMIENEMISVDPLDENIEILQNGIDYLAKNEA